MVGLAGRIESWEMWAAAEISFESYGGNLTMRRGVCGGGEKGPSRPAMVPPSRAMQLSMYCAPYQNDSSVWRSSPSDTAERFQKTCQLAACRLSISSGIASLASVAAWRSEEHTSELQSP